MLSSYRKKQIAAARQQGFAAFVRLGWNWLKSSYRLLTWEPARKLRPMEPRKDFDGDRPRIAVQMHVFYPEILPELMECTNRIPYRFDCYISTDTEEKRAAILQMMEAGSHAARVQVECFENRGRDMAPMLLQLPAEVLSRYDFLLHLHSKYSAHEGFGNRWRRHLLRTLLDSPEYIAALLEAMEKEHIGLVFQRTFWRVKLALGWHGNRPGCRALLDRLGIAGGTDREPRFPAGNMFWASTGAVAPVFSAGLNTEDFAPEAGQVDGTLAHCIERCWGIVARAGGYASLRVRP